MKILFVLRHAMYVRNYESTVLDLASRGHSVHMGFTMGVEKLPADAYGQAREMAQKDGRISFGEIAYRDDIWWPLASQVRMCQDFLRYLHPRYKNAARLAERARRRVFPPAQWVRHIPGLRGPRGTALLTALLRLCESAIPCDPGTIHAIEEHDPDIVLLTPLVDFASNQLDYLKAALSMGIPTALMVASWDNLTNKGLVQLCPDLIVLWNEDQKREAVELHGLPADRVAVTGAQLYDHWFAQKPSTRPEEFKRKVGLDAERRYLLYLCSSVFIARNEVSFVKRWIEAIRSSQNPAVRELGVLIRPHPANARQWSDVDLSIYGGVAVWPRAGAHPVNAGAKAEFFDSLHHSFATVGINTSASIEAGIVGRRCFSILDPEFAETQDGTLHFRYLKEGGLLVVSQSIVEHLEQLERLLSGSLEDEAGRQRFLQRFVRPHGLMTPATPIVTAALERLEVPAREARSASGPGPRLPRGVPFYLWPLTGGLFLLALVTRALLGSMRKKGWRQRFSPRWQLQRARKVLGRQARRVRKRLGRKRRVGKGARLNGSEEAQGPRKREVQERA